MTQSTNTPSWSQTFQLQLMAALDAAWAILDGSDDPMQIRKARDKAKAVGELAAMVRKVAAIVPTARKPPASAVAAGLAAVADMDVSLPESFSPALAPQAEHARRALDKLKGGRRGRL
jgi:hypothetical protein